MKRWSSYLEDYLQPLVRGENLRHATESGGVGWMTAVAAVVVVVVFCDSGGGRGDITSVSV